MTLKGSRYLSFNLVIVGGALLSMGMPPLFLPTLLRILPLGLYRGALDPDKNRAPLRTGVRRVLLRTDTRGVPLLTCDSDDTHLRLG